MRTVAIIQARMQSSRLPGKVLADLHGRPVLQRVVERARRANALDVVVVATTDDPADDPVALFCDQQGIDCFRGSQEDVLDRYYRTARVYHAQLVVRLTADCPLIDPALVDRVVRTYRLGEFDYVSNALDCTFPDGLDTEVFSFKVLKRAWREASWQSQREHVTSYITDHPELFRLGSVRGDEDLSALRWTVDEPEDLEFVRAVYDAYGGEPPGMHEILGLLRKHPHLAQINQGFERNEGYALSLREDRLIK